MVVIFQLCIGKHLVGCLLVMVCCFTCTSLFVKMMSLHCHGGVYIGYKRMSKGVKVMQNPTKEFFNIMATIVSL